MKRMNLLEKISPNPATQFSAMLILSSIALHVFIVAVSISTGNMKQLLTSAGIIFILIGALLAMKNIADKVDKPTVKNDQAE